MSHALTPYFAHWQLEEKGPVISTHSSTLQPVKMSNGKLAMLKVAHEKIEKLGHFALRYWNGIGAAKLYDHHEDAVLLEYSSDNNSLLNMALNGEDHQATKIICQTFHQLHQSGGQPIPSEIITLQEWLESLFIQVRTPTIERLQPIFSQAVQIAQQLLAAPQSFCMLHGDLHHSNVLHFAHRGWLAIDPKFLAGEHYYDYTSILCNPDLGELCYDSVRYDQQLALICQLAHLNKHRLNDWAIAHSALSAAWFLEDNEIDLAEKELAITQLALHKRNALLYK